MSNTVKYTQGEWKVNDRLQITVYGRGVIADIPTVQDGGVMGLMANAKLIASCPTLFEQSERNHAMLLRCYNMLASQCSEEFLQELRQEMKLTLEVIAKATN